MTKHRVTVTVFAEVDDAISVLDAGRVVEHLIYQALSPNVSHQVTVRENTWTVAVHKIEETGSAIRKGHIVFIAADAAYNGTDR
jgi:ABC-type dipeptide/oligopeptide/nickel transport system ATPase component